ncbi:RbsD/FucU family protein [Demequina lutea]|uniref:L-fucose mutarotase n=1 Tax=Demequina lutea TaxID=431489 RepID=A0A7Z0CI70_9MICO|nr:RbsD/FucU domain-containing protein [Demequina lutea]NYI41594.1 L-fucose mutarotase [Demequina lutea]
MLKGIDPVLHGELLHILDDMGHGDQLLLVDRNYPAAASGKPVLRLGEIGVERAARAILSVMPLDTFLDHPLERMEVDGDPSIVAPVQAAVLEIARAHHPEPLEFGIVPRLWFYERAKEVFAVVHTLEDQPYGCFILHKGVIFPDAP